MKILVATGIYPPEIGGPAMYAKSLAEEFKREGHQVKVSTYGRERNLPTGIRHIIYFIKSIPKIIWSDKILALDTFSIGVPVAVASLLFSKPYVIRIGGDFLWENYIERTHKSMPLPDFYNQEVLADLNVKERIIFNMTKFAVNRASCIIFTTPWLRDIWTPIYNIRKSSIVENVLERKEYKKATVKRFLWAGRRIFLKNMVTLKKSFEEARDEVKDIELECVQVPRQELERKLEECYAVILPSLSEVSPNLAHDAIAYGKPLIVTRYSGLDEGIKDISLEINPLSVDDIKDKIVKLSNDQVYSDIRVKIDKFRHFRSWNLVAKEFLAKIMESK